MTISTALGDGRCGVDEDDGQVDGEGLREVFA